jgi:hypothetical protein
MFLEVNLLTAYARIGTILDLCTEATGRAQAPTPSPFELEVTVWMAATQAFAREGETLTYILQMRQLPG